MTYIFTSPWRCSKTTLAVAWDHHSPFLSKHQFLGHLFIWLVVGALPLGKIMDFVSWIMKFPTEWENKKKQTTNQSLYLILALCFASLHWSDSDRLLQKASSSRTCCTHFWTILSSDGGSKFQQKTWGIRSHKTLKTETPSTVFGHVLVSSKHPTFLKSSPSCRSKNPFCELLIPPYTTKKRTLNLSNKGSPHLPTFGLTPGIGIVTGEEVPFLCHSHRGLFHTNQFRWILEHPELHSSALSPGRWHFGKPFLGSHRS